LGFLPQRVLRIAGLLRDNLGAHRASAHQDQATTKFTMQRVYFTHDDMWSEMTFDCRMKEDHWMLRVYFTPAITKKYFDRYSQNINPDFIEYMRAKKPYWIWDLKEKFLTTVQTKAESLCYYATWSDAVIYSRLRETCVTCEAFIILHLNMTTKADIDALLRCIIRDTQEFKDRLIPLPGLKGALVDALSCHEFMLHSCIYDGVSVGDAKKTLDRVCTVKEIMNMMISQVWRPPAEAVM
jgi:hypothetical protein